MIHLSGLSLCIQGTYHEKLPHQHARRFIPVYTGNIPTVIFFNLFSTVYPCVYREHQVSFSEFRLVYGLSLCVQGTYPFVPQRAVVSRFIPVCTGNMFKICSQTWATPVYPCVYREHEPVPRSARPITGLSLCVQGTYQL